MNAHSNQPQPPAQQGRGPSVLQAVWLVASAFAVTLEVFLRREMGSRYLDRQAAAAVLLIPGFGLFFPERDLRPLMWFLGAYLLACSVVRARSLRRRFRGEEEHSRYSGWPVVLRLPLVRRLREARAKAIAEPLLVWIAGGLTLAASVPLGAYLMTAALCLLLCEGMRRGYDAQRLMDMKDALSDQRRLAERFRRRPWS